MLFYDARYIEEFYSFKYKLSTWKYSWSADNLDKEYTKAKPREIDINEQICSRKASKLDNKSTNELFQITFLYCYKTPYSAA